MFTCDKNFGECLEDAVKKVLEDYAKGEPSGIELLSALEKVVNDGVAIALEMDYATLADFEKYD
jgi:hypothetical protein